MKHVMRLKTQPFAMIKSGEKRIELRLNDEKRQKIRIGDEITFVHAQNEAETLCCTVTALYPFPSFEKLYEKLPINELGYTMAELKTASPADMDKYYSKEEQERYGVLGIRIKKI